MSGLVDWATDDDELRVGRRRFRRRRDDREPGDPAGEVDETADLQAELLLLREENARLKAAQHVRPDIARALHGARALTDAVHPDGPGDDAQQLLVEGLVIRESLLVICREIERAMVAFEARLSALGDVPAAAEARVA